MVRVEEAVDELLKECPILSDKNFQKKHPAIVDVATFLNGTAKTHYRAMGKYEFFDKLGVNNIKDYLALIQKGSSEAVDSYKKVKDILGLE